MSEDQIMSGDDLKKSLDDLKINQMKLASICGVSQVQVSKWINNHSPVPVYVITIIDLLRKEQTYNSLIILEKMAGVFTDGHYTICKFTSNYRVGLSTPCDREYIGKMCDGANLNEAISKYFSVFQKQAYGNSNK